MKFRFLKFILYLIHIINKSCFESPQIKALI